MRAEPPPASSPADFDASLAKLVRGSRLVTVLSILGLLAVLGALVFSGRELTQLNQQRRSLDQQIQARQNELRLLADSLVRTREAFSAYTAVVRREQPALAAVAAEVARDSARAARVVYIQFRGSLPRALAERLRARLNQLGYNAPGVERIDRPFSNSIRYFHEGDAPAAAELARQAAAFFKEQGCAADFPVQNLSERAFTVPPGQVELWIDLNCPAPAAAS